MLDLAWVAAMPLATRVLAHWGATVVRIESEHRPDILRAALGHRDDIPDQDERHHLAHGQRRQARAWR